MSRSDDELDRYMLDCVVKAETIRTENDQMAKDANLPGIEGEMRRAAMLAAIKSSSPPQVIYWFKVMKMADITVEQTARVMCLADMMFPKFDN